MKQISILAAALVAGFAGGFLNSYLILRQPSSSPQIIRAHSFEVVDEEGRTISYWGLDKGQNLVLAFADPETVVNGNSLGLRDPHNQKTAIGFIGGSPDLMFRAVDGTSRLTLRLGPWDRPTMLMEDETGYRLHLGYRQDDTASREANDWVLDFLPDVAGIGMAASLEGKQTYIRGMFYVNKEKRKYPADQPK